MVLFLGVGAQKMSHDFSAVRFGATVSNLNASPVHESFWRFGWGIRGMRIKHLALCVLAAVVSALLNRDLGKADAARDLPSSIISYEEDLFSSPLDRLPAMTEWLPRCEEPPDVTRDWLPLGSGAGIDEARSFWFSQPSSYLLFRDHLHPRLAAVLFKQYPEFHAKQRACWVRNGISSEECAGALVWTCPPKSCAGTNDRMRGIFFLYLIAAATKRVLLIDWTTPASLISSLAPAEIDWRLPYPIAVYRRRARMRKELPVTLNMDQYQWFKQMGDRSAIEGGRMPNVSELPAEAATPGEQGSNASLDLLSDDLQTRFRKSAIVVVTTRLHPKVAYVLANPFMREELLGNQSVDLMNEVTRESSIGAVFGAIAHVLFKPSVRLAVAVQSRLQHLPPNYSSMHVRLGGDFGETSDLRFVDHNSRRKELAYALLDCLDSVEQRRVPNLIKRRFLYLATDSHDFKLLVKKAGERRGIRVITSDRTALHISDANSEVIADANSGILAAGSKWDTDPLCGSFEDVFLDLWILGHASTMITTGGGFSDLAIRMGNVSNIGATRLRAAGSPAACDIVRPYSRGFRVDAQSMRQKGF